MSLLSKLSGLEYSRQAFYVTKGACDGTGVMDFFTRGVVQLELRCPRCVGGVVIDPQPDWSFDILLSELKSIENKLNASPQFPLPFTKTKSREVSSAKSAERKAFVMRIEEMEDEDSDEEAHDKLLVTTTGRKFGCNELFFSDDSDNESCGKEYQLMYKVGMVESALSELTNEHQLSVAEEIRNEILVLESNLMDENKRLSCALAQVKKSAETRREIDTKLDMHYQRKIAEALDNHLTVIQRNHEHKSQMEERRIRDAAAIEEAKRREQAIQQEKLWQEKARAEAEMQARLEAEKKRAEEDALEAKKKAEEDSARAKEPIRPQTDTSLGIRNDKSEESGSNGLRKVKQAGNIVRCAESALKVEERRLQIYQEVAVQNEALRLGGSDHLSHGSKILRLARQISGTKENVRNKADQLTKILFDSSCPQSISIAMFSEKIVDECLRKPSNITFGYAHVIVLVASKVPLAMDLLLAKLNRDCIYTVPKYITYSKSVFDTKEAHHKAIGYKEEGGEIESEASYTYRMEAYMKLYGALVQTEIAGVQNIHGLREGWTWLARFLNTLPANLYSAVALQAFLDMAGFALYRRYKSHFKKLLNVIYRDFVNALKQRGGDTRLIQVIGSIQGYIEENKFLEEPEGRSLQGQLLSSACVPESGESQPSYHQHQSNRYYNRY